MRPDLAQPSVSAAAATSIQAFQSSVVDEVKHAIANHKVVVVGMGWNPHVRRARKALDAAGVAYHYLGYGNYLSAWKPRLAIKIWSGWPTFPQIYVGGTLIGGADQTEAAIADRSLTAMLAA
ncbi:MAG: glutaredoxin domain-containing protein [Myxococcota bacterium]